MSKSKIVAIGGPTASGKSSIAIELAKNFNGEIINTDSRQFYKHLNIGTAKEEISERMNNQVLIKKVAHHLIDFLEPDEEFNLARFQKLAFEKIEEITSRGKLPILVGGTGLYIDAVVYNYDLTEEEVNPKRREELSKLSVSKLQKILNKLSPAILKKMTPSDQKNPHRLIRKIEKLESNKPKDRKKELLYNFLYLAVTPENQKERISERVDKMFEEGLKEENQKIRERGYTTELNSLRAIGYQEFDKYFEGNKTLEDVKKDIKLHTRQYAKRQMTWFKKNEEIIWIENIDQAKKAVNGFIQS